MFAWYFQNNTLKSVSLYFWISEPIWERRHLFAKAGVFWGGENPSNPTPKYSTKHLIWFQKEKKNIKLFKFTSWLGWRKLRFKHSVPTGYHNLLMLIKNLYQPKEFYMENERRTKSFVQQCSDISSVSLSSTNKQCSNGKQARLWNFISSFSQSHRFVSCLYACANNLICWFAFFLCGLISENRKLKKNSRTAEVSQEKTTKSYFEKEIT